MKDRKKQASPFVAVDAIVVLDDSIVLIERKNEPLGFALPGGFVEVGESVQDAVAREIKEEIGISLKSVTELKTYSDPTRDPRAHVISVLHLCEAEDGAVPNAGDDASKCHVVKFTDISKYNLVFDHGQMIQDFFDAVGATSKVLNLNGIPYLQ